MPTVQEAEVKWVEAKKRLAEVMEEYRKVCSRVTRFEDEEAHAAVELQEAKRKARQKE